MLRRTSPPSRAQIERARAKYREGFTVSRILAACDMSLGTFYYWLDGGPHAGPPVPAPASAAATPGKPAVAGAPLSGPPADASAAGRAAAGGTLYPPPFAGDRVSLAARLWRTAERQARDLEERLARPSASTPERERDLRMFGAVVRALRDLSAFDPARGEAAAAVDADPAAEDIDEFRRELARRIHALIDARQARAAEEKAAADADEAKRHRGSMAKS